jgi:hypothetical protein
MVRSAATPRVSNHEARWMLDNSTQPENALVTCFDVVHDLGYPVEGCSPYPPFA